MLRESELKPMQSISLWRLQSSGGRRCTYRWLPLGTAVWVRLGGTLERRTRSEVRLSGFYFSCVIWSKSLNCWLHWIFLIRLVFQSSSSSTILWFLWILCKVCVWSVCVCVCARVCACACRYRSTQRDIYKPYILYYELVTMGNHNSRCPDSSQVWHGPGGPETKLYLCHGVRWSSP